MKAKKDIFTNPLDFDQDHFDDATININDLVDKATDNINDTKGLGPDYARNNPEFLAGFLLALTLDHNSRHLIQSLQEGVVAVIEELRKNREAVK